MEKDRKEATRELKITATELKKLEYRGEVPSENDLRGTRDAHNSGAHHHPNDSYGSRDHDSIRQTRFLRPDGYLDYELGLCACHVR